MTTTVQPPSHKISGIQLFYAIETALRHLLIGRQVVVEHLYNDAEDRFEHHLQGCILAVKFTSKHYLTSPDPRIECYVQFNPHRTPVWLDIVRLQFVDDSFLEKNINPLLEQEVISITTELTPASPRELVLVK